MTTRDYSHDRGDVLEPCDICLRDDAFDVQEVFNGAIEPWNWDSAMICQSCRQSEAMDRILEEKLFDRWYREEQEWLDNGGQELIDAESNIDW